jgi:hypothetical protein
MEGGPDERYHICLIGRAQDDGLRGGRRERPRKASGAPDQAGGKLFRIMLVVANT